MKIVSLLVSLFLFSSCVQSNVTFYVSPEGNDTNPGTLEQPVATLQKAQELVRHLPNRNVNVNVIFRGGEYHLSDKVIFTVDDSAPEGYSYSYEAYPGETPVFTSAVKLTQWKKTKNYPVAVDADLLNRIWEVEYDATLDKPYVLFSEGKMIHRSKKGGFIIDPIKPLSLDKHKEHPAADEYNASRSMNVYYAKDRYLLKQFGFKDVKNVIKNWTAKDELEVAFAPVPWALNILPVEKVDLKKGMMYTSIESNAPAGAKSSHTMPWIENALEYITPGTFVVRGNKIYYCKNGNENIQNISMPTLTEMVLIAGDINYDGEDHPVKNIIFKGLTFTAANRYTWAPDHKGWGIQHDWDKFDAPNAMLRMRGAENCVVEECRFTNSGCSAIRLDLYCQHNVIKNNLIDYVGHMGVLLCGYGPGTKDVNKYNTIANNLMHHVGQVITHGAGIFVWQSGENLISHNLIHNVPRKGIGLCGVRAPILIKDWCDFDEASKTIRWNELDQENFKRYKNNEMTLGEYWKTCQRYLHARNNRVEYNEVHHALEALADGSVINVSGAGMGNVVYSNYVHHVLSHASGALRTDDWQCNTIFENNIVYKSFIAGTVHKGYNDVVNNYFVDCSPKSYIRFASYPDEEAGYGSKVQRNIFFETSQKNKFYGVNYLVSKGICKPENCETDYNLFFSKFDSKAPAKHLEEYRALGIEKNSMIGNPMFKEVDGKLSFVLDTNSPAFQLGIKQIDVDKIGLVKSEFPKSLYVYGETDTPMEEGDFRKKASASNSYEFW